MLTHPIKVVYNFLVSIQIISFIVFMFYLIESGLDITIPMNISIPITSSIKFHFNYSFHFNIITIIAILVSMIVIYIISSLSISAVGSGVSISDEGTISIKQIVSFIFKFSLLNLPVLFIFSRSGIFSAYSGVITLFSLIIYVLNFLIDLGSESNDI